MNTRTRILPLWAPSKDWAGKSWNSRSHHRRLAVDEHVAYHLMHSAGKSWNKSRIKCRTQDLNPGWEPPNFHSTIKYRYRATSIHHVRVRCYPTLHSTDKKAPIASWQSAMHDHDGFRSGDLVKWKRSRQLQESVQVFCSYFITSSMDENDRYWIFLHGKTGTETRLVIQSGDTPTIRLQTACPCPTSETCAIKRWSLWSLRARQWTARACWGMTSLR